MASCQGLGTRPRIYNIYGAFN